MSYLTRLFFLLFLGIHSHILFGAKSFSSYTKGLYPITAVFENDQSINLYIQLPLSFKAKLEKRFEKHRCSIVSIDGVCAEVTILESQKELLIFAEMDKQQFFLSSLPYLTPGSSVSIGMLSDNPEKWLLDSSPVGTVLLRHIETAPGHTYTKECLFECSKEIFNQIQSLQYVGLNGSGVFVRNPHKENGHFYFAIHAGRQTQERTLFGQDTLSSGILFTLILPFNQSQNP